MTGAVVLAVLAAVGVLGLASGLRSTGPSLDEVLTTWQRAGATGVGGDRRDAGSPGARVVAWVRRSRWASDERVRGLETALAVTGSDPVAFATRLLLVAAGGFVAVLGTGLVLAACGLPVPSDVVVVVALLAAPAGVGLAVGTLLRSAAERRRHVRVVVSSFVDLVVLSLAGGVGVDGALYSASQVSPDWASQRMARALLAARDSGVAPWAALAALGRELGVPELVELSTTVQLAGTEGARIRQSLSARGASLRRHEQADAESAANTMTERLFLPGALLLLGFLVFIGFPAVHRIVGGF